MKNFKEQYKSCKKSQNEIYPELVLISSKVVRYIFAINKAWNSIGNLKKLIAA